VRVPLLLLHMTESLAVADAAGAGEEGADEADVAEGVEGEARSGWRRT
jgi:hypothetical protein